MRRYNSLGPKTGMIGLSKSESAQTLRGEWIRQRSIRRSDSRFLRDVGQIVACVLVCGCIGSLHAQSDPLADIDAYVEESMQTWQVPGLAVAIVKDDVVVLTKGYGTRQTGRDLKVDENTVFDLASVTKGFTAAAVAVLVDEEKLAWDRPVIDYLPWLRLPAPWVTGQVTLRDLLSHRVGGDLGAHAGNADLRRLHLLRATEPHFRSRFQYSNTGFEIVGEVIQAVTGMPWHAFVQARLLAPLGMTSTFTSPLDLWDLKDIRQCGGCVSPRGNVAVEAAKVENIAMPHLLSDSGPSTIAWVIHSTKAKTHPACCMSSNAADMAKWLRFQLASGGSGERRILNSAAFREMHKPQMVIPYNYYPVGRGANTFWAYGMGWALTYYGGHKVVLHGGGFHSLVAMVPEQNLAVAVLSNAGGPFTSINHLRLALPFRILDAYLGLPQRDWSGELLQLARETRKRRAVREREATRQRVGGTDPSLAIEKYAGTYSHPAYGEFLVDLEDGGLVLRYPDGDIVDLEHWHYDTFRMKYRGPDREPYIDFATFTLGIRGAIEELNIEWPGQSSPLGPLKRDHEQD